MSNTAVTCYDTSNLKQRYFYHVENCESCGKSHIITETHPLLEQTDEESHVFICPVDKTVVTFLGNTPTKQL